jgi:rhamnose utilization protein RhaD (predicted bifunctional aldolase and dehydrogenase)
MADLAQSLADLVDLSHQLGSPTEELAILAEGNAGTKLSDSTFLVKASGFSMSNLDESGLIEVQFAPILEALDGDLPDSEVRGLLESSRARPSGPLLPSVETFMHAFLLTLPDVTWVGHTHPTPLLSLLALEDAKSLARRRIFPDEIVCCGPASAYLPYVDPGMPLARAVRHATLEYIEEWGAPPKTIWMQNHGLIALGQSPKEVMSATLMAQKSARAWLGALQTGMPVVCLTAAQIARIHTRPDEHYRQRLLWAQSGKGPT